nr:MAG TPA: hypothetical protein [Caudoviricetes sp.]
MNDAIKNSRLIKSRVIDDITVNIRVSTVKDGTQEDVTKFLLELLDD